VPDGTEGETMEVSKNEKVLVSNHWYEFDGKYSTLKIGGGILYDFVTYSQDEVSKEQIELTPEIKLRDFRVIAGGKIKTKRFITWKLA
jgi:phosphate-selective porin OprO/OprP